MNTRTTPFVLAVTAIVSLALAGCATQPELAKGDEARFSAAMPDYQDYGAVNGAIYNSQSAQILFADYKARRVGDILTVLLDEETNAQNSTNTSTSRDTNMTLLDPTILGRPVTRDGNPILNTDVQSSRSFDGQGQASQSNLLEGSITVTVSAVLPNGNLVVQGEKWIRINRGEEYIQLRGIVRPVDISADNTVLSTQVADAELAYGGNGPVARSTAEGWFNRFFGRVLWPF